MSVTSEKDTERNRKTSEAYNADGVGQLVTGRRFFPVHGCDLSPPREHLTFENPTAPCDTPVENGGDREVLIGIQNKSFAASPLIRVRHAPNSAKLLSVPARQQTGL